MWDINNNTQRIYIGRVNKVSRLEDKQPIKDYLGNELNPLEILFTIDGVVENSRAMPIDSQNEVKENDPVIIFSLENVYNNTFYYNTVRYISETNGSIYMGLNGSEVVLFPTENSKSELIMASGKSVIHIDPNSQRINVESGLGGVNINSHRGFVSISNDRTSLKKILSEILQELSVMKVLTPNGIGTTHVSSSIKFQESLLKVNNLFQDIDSSSKFPHIPLDTLTPEFVSSIVLETGVKSLDDDNMSGQEVPEVAKVISELPESVIGQNPSPNSSPQISNVTPGDVQSQDINYECEITKATNIENIVLSENYKVKDLTTKALYPHKLIPYKGLSYCDQVKNMKALAINILEPVKEHQQDIRINSGFRSKSSISGRTSQHELAEAVDLQFPSLSHQQYFELAEWIIENVIFDQLIFEHGKSIWLHISYSRTHNRKKVLTMLHNNYENGLKLYY